MFVNGCASMHRMLAATVCGPLKVKSPAWDCGTVMLMALLRFLQVDVCAACAVRKQGLAAGYVPGAAEAPYQEAAQPRAAARLSRPAARRPTSQAESSPS
jgi:hypothetical protein